MRFWDNALPLLCYAAAFVYFVTPPDSALGEWMLSNMTDEKRFLCISGVFFMVLGVIIKQGYDIEGKKDR